MNTGPDFEAYLISKKIDSTAFRQAEPAVWENWRREFEQMHPKSFTVQKLNLINPVRRKYQLPPAPEAGSAPPVESLPATPMPATAPAQGKPVVRPGRPVMKPRPK